MKKLFYLFFVLHTFQLVQAQDLKINAELKSRYEYLNGFGKMRPAPDSLDNAASFISQRSRISLVYNNPSKKLVFGATLQDVRTWGATDQANIGDKNNLGVHEFWGNIMFSEHFSTKVGRQELNYDNGRIIGSVDWSQQARSFDAAVLKYIDTTSQIKIDFGLGYNTKSQTLLQEVYDLNNYKSMQFIWLNKKFKTFNASILFLNNGLEYTVNPANPITISNRKIAYSQTIGGQVGISKSYFNINIEGYNQIGKTSGNKQTSAWNLKIEIVAKLSKHFSPVIGSEWLSGTDMDETDGKNHSFNPLYGTNHKFNGTMDYFYVGGRWQNGIGLADNYAGLRFKHKNFDAECMAHLFSSMANAISNNATLSKKLATEIDIIGKYNLTEMIAFQSGFSVLSGSSTLETLTAGSTKSKLNTWAWMQIIIKPTLYNSSKK